jgi:membrane-associated phospholipid phosphatase
MGDTLGALDVAASTWLHTHPLPLFTRVMIAVSFLGAPSTLTPVSLLIALFLALRRRFGESLALPAVVLGGNLLNFWLKQLIQRGRPVFDDPILTLPTYSFPSGHAMASTVFYGLLALYAAGAGTQYTARPMAVFGAAAVIMLVCFSRIYLGLHYLSDVGAGLMEGIAWLALCTTALRCFRGRWPGLPRI